jgi:hypothetical protein
MNLKQNCNVCSKTINFSNIHQSLDDVIMINYHNYLNYCNNVIIICSKQCLSNYKNIDLIGCVECNNKCSTPKWFVETKFINLGGWLSSKAICSENCREHFMKVLVLDKELSVMQSCAYCFKYTKSSMKKCSKCRIIYYCDEICQKNDWPKHKLTCK